MAVDAAKRNGLTVGKWLERAIDENVGTLPPETDPPLVSAELLASAREQIVEDNVDLIAEFDNPEGQDQQADPTSEPASIESDSLEEAGSVEFEAEEAEPEQAEQQQLPLLSPAFKKRKRRVPNVSPMLIAAESRRTPGNLLRIIGGLVLVTLIGGTYWVIDQNTKNKLAAETDAVAGRSAATSNAAKPATTNNGGDGGQTQSQQSATPTQSATLTPLQRLTALATSGNARAQHDLGLKYLEGKGVPRDPKQGALWLEKSANSDMPNAQYHIGLLYQKGEGVSADLKQTYQWFLKAGRNGHVRAQHSLGTLYLEGKGTKRDYAEATRWFTRASKAGLAEAHYSLGTIHENGLGVDTDQRKAAAYYRRALAAGSARAAGKLTRLEPALKELSAAVDTTLLEKVVTRSDPENSQRPAKERTLSAVGIKQLQQLLKKLDLEPGPADGVLGNKTKEAIRLYQRFAGLPVDGKPTFDLLLDLRQVVDAMSADKPAGVGGR